MDSDSDVDYYECIKNASVNSKAADKPDKGDHCMQFLPRNQAQALAQRDFVKSRLAEFQNKNGFDELINFYVAENASKVFLTLVCMEAPYSIWKFFQMNNLTNDFLPVREEFEYHRPVFRGINLDGTAKNLERESLALLPKTVWTTRKREDFFRDQWLFMAPTIRESQFTYEFAHECRLPFVDIEDGKFHRGYFGAVYQLGLRLDHTDFTSSRLLSSTNGDHIEVALKVMTIQQTQTTDTDVEKFYNKEKETLQLMRDLKHKHLIRAFAAYKRAHFRCFVFPWARGGNLQNFWESDPSKLDRNLVTWAVQQMHGICEGVWKLHKKHVRHGDIKPLNILYFPKSGKEFAWGDLVIADVGLAKVHETYTRDRKPGTTTKHGTNMYEPPEMVSFSVEVTKISQKYDIWSLGCIFLEFMIWLLYGQEKLQSFYGRLGAANTRKFWVTTESGYDIHEHVKYRIGRIKAKLHNEGALGRLISLISEKLLVAEEKRATAEVLASDMEVIKTQCPVEKLGNLGTGVESMAKKRSGPMSKSQADEGPISPSKQPRTSNLDNRWRTIPQNRRARILISRLTWATLRPETETIGLCASCKIVDFLACPLSLGRNLGDLGRGAVACPMCRFLHRCLSKYSVNYDEGVELSADKDEGPYMLSHNAVPVISIYLDPESSVHQLPQVQFGLPLLPPSGSSHQFDLLKEWVRLCNEEHHCVASQADTLDRVILPTRLIDVGDDRAPSLCLIETEPNRVTGHYIALSHCWGVLPEAKRVCTYADNIDSFKKGIPFHALPQTFQDAVTVTRALGIRYLWIDSLCIIQRDEKDWKSEAVKMEGVFSSAYCTIAASSSTSSLDGFLLDRAQRAAIGIQTPRGTFYLAESIDSFEAHVENGILNTRGWVLQERALSRRTIHFTSTQVYWECGKGVHCETLAELGKQVTPEFTSRQSMFLGDSSFPTYGLEHYKDERIRLVQYLYQTYSGLNLTMASDRSRAILGLQKRLGYTFKSTADYGVISTYFERTVLWQAEVPGSLSQIDYGPSQTVPSWSWMALVGRIRYLEIPFGGVTWTGDLENPFQPGFDDSKWDGRLVASAKRLTIDDAEFEKRCKVDLSLGKFNPNTWKCVNVGKSKVVNGEGDINQYVLLIRERSSVVSPPVYERVGVGILSQRHVALETTTVQIA